VKIIFDIDSTLANTDHRHHFITERKPKDWDSFFAAAINDTPIIPAVVIYECLARDYHDIEFWTGRPERYRALTILWLEKFLGKHAKFRILKMRGNEDRRDDNVVKLEFIDHEDAPDLIFEDRKRVVDAYRAQGLTVYQVAEGDF